MNVKALFITLVMIIGIPYIIYRCYVGFVILSKKRKYGKSDAMVNWYINNDPIRRFFLFGTFKRVKIEKHKYKILKNDEEEVKDETP